MQPEHLTVAQKVQSDRDADSTLRPKVLEEFIGQTQLKKNLCVFMGAANKRREPLEHVLLHGPPGLGKTTLAQILAYEMRVPIKITSGPVLDKQGDLAAILTNLKDGSVFFIDEIHRLKPAIEEVLYTAMEDFGFDIVLGKGPSARSMRLSLPRFTLVGATTKLSMLSSPLRDRFGTVFKLEFYTVLEIAQIIRRSASIIGCCIDESGAHLLAHCSRHTPRIANRLLRRVRDFADVNEHHVIGEATVRETLQTLGVDDLGLDRSDRGLLQTVIDKFQGGPVGLNTLAAALSEQEATIEDVYEPYLIQLGFLERTARGRVVKRAAYEHLGISFIS